VNRLVEAPILDSALAMAAEFTGYGLPALGFAREAVQRALDLPICEGLKVEADLSTLAYRTQDAEEGMAAFSEKRKPAFRDA
jgi:enoyl-CoA hydratase